MGFEQKIPEQVEVTCTPGVMGGQPCIDGTRVPAELILLYIREGASRREIFSDYPFLPVGSIEAVLRWAEAQGIDVPIPV